MEPTKPDRVNSSPPLLRVLITEDNPRDAKLMASVLEGAGFTVQYEVTDSLEFFRERLEKADYDVILADFNLRNWTAIDALEILKRSGKDIPLIVVTGTLGDEAAVDCIKRGAADFVLKDRPARLPAAVQRALEEKRLRAENKRAFQAISRLATIVESSDDAIIGTTLEGAITSWNKGAEKLYRYSTAEVLGQPISILIPPDWSEEMTQMLERLRHGGVVEYFETVRVRKGGSRIDVSLGVFPLRDTSGQITGTASITRDITEHKEVEQALREREAHFRSLFENMLNGFAYCKMHFDQGQAVDFTYLNVNRAFETLTGLKRVVGRPVSEVTPGIRESDPELFEIFGRVALTGTPERFEGFVNALKMWFSISVYSPRKEYFVVIFDVITERKKAEESLRESEERFRATFEDAGIGMALVDVQGHPFKSNPALQQMLGYSEEELSRMVFTEYTHPDDRELDWRLFSELTTGKRDQYEMEKRLLKKGGDVVWGLLTVSLVKDRHGRPMCAIGMAQDITKRKLAETENARLAAVVSSSDDAIFSVTPEGLIATWNAGAERMYGYLAEEIKGKHIDVLIPEDRRGDLAVNRGKLYRGEVLAHYEFEHMRKDGSKLQVSETLSPIKDPAGVVTGVSIIARDITDRKRGEEALHESEERFRTAFEDAPLGMCLTALDGRFLQVNGELCQMLGYSKQELLEGGWQKLTHPDDLERSRQSLDQLVEGLISSVEFEKRYLHKNGNVIWVRLKISVVKNAHRAPTHFITHVEDITERKRAEAEHVRLVTAIEQSAEAVVITNTNGDIEYVNPAFTRITGYSRAEVLGQNPRILKSGKQDPAFYQQLWATILKGETWHGELINRRKDGSLYTEQMGIASVRGERGEITHFIATKQDVTDRKRLEQQFFQAQKMEAVGRLAGGVAHDFNNLLTIINGYAALLTERTSPKDPRRGLVQEILMAGERAASLTRQLLAFSRRQVMEPRVLDLNSVLANTEKMLRRLIGEDVELVTTLDPGLGLVKLDPGQIEQVIMNLVVNARDAMPEGGKFFIETSNVEVDENTASNHATFTPGKYVMMAVSDTGCGMDMETQDRIFEPFFTTKEKGRGTGLGLATVYGIVKQSGGFIWVYSEPRRGSTFKIYFPCAGEDVPTAEPAKFHATKVGKGSETIVVVEDEGGVRSLVCRTLTSHGYKVLEAAGAEQALRIAEQHTELIHLLLTDVVMPQAGGKELAERLSTLHPEIKVLYMSGYTDDAIVRHGILEGGTPFLQKPFAPNALLLKVREVLKMNPGTRQ